MASRPVLPIDDLLKPISGENPAGSDPRGDHSPSSPYYSVKEARKAARAAERQYMFDRDDGEAHTHWRVVAEVAPSVLEHQAKDLELASWLTEALVRRYGFQGLRDGFKLIRGLVERYWEELYPLPDEDGLATRVAPLAGLNGEGTEGVLIAPIRNIPITDGNDPGPFSYWQYQQVLEIERLVDAEARAERAAKLEFGKDDIERAVSNSHPQFYIDIRDDIAEAIADYKAIDAILTNNCGSSGAPPCRNIINILEECLGAINHLAKDKLPLASEPSQETDTTESIVELTHVAQRNVDGIKTREEAFRRLAEISNYFLETEPHSPISYILRRAVKWGSMPLEHLIGELIPDPSAREHFSQLTGVTINDD